MKKGLMSCHRCLIFLGDLTSGEGDTVNRDYAAASSYYIQAVSLCPSSGNPCHQLATLASYSGDDLVSLYCYFRILAADVPFSTARDNLIIAFEKARFLSGLKEERVHAAEVFKSSGLSDILSSEQVDKGEAD